MAAVCFEMLPVQGAEHVSALEASREEGSPITVKKYGEEDYPCDDRGDTERVSRLDL